MKTLLLTVIGNYVTEVVTDVNGQVHILPDFPWILSVLMLALGTIYIFRAFYNIFK